MHTDFEYIQRQKTPNAAECVDQHLLCTSLTLCSFSVIQAVKCYAATILTSARSRSHRKFSFDFPLLYKRGTVHIFRHWCEQSLILT